MKTYLLTWNPKRYPFAELPQKVEATRSGNGTRDRWITGTSRRARKGDLVFLLRQGIEPKGIVGSGRVTRDSYQDQHWDERRAHKLGNYLDFTFDALLDPVCEPPLRPPIDGVFAAVHWNSQMSGIEIPDEAALELEIVWVHHLASLDIEPNLHEHRDDAELSAFEGTLRKLFVSHRFRERKLRAKKIEAVLGQTGVLRCEVEGCGFDFFQVYGDIGKDFAHVHHRRPLADHDGPIKTSLDDLAIVCANCHAMVHRGGECRSLDELISRQVFDAMTRDEFNPEGEVREFFPKNEVAAGR